MASALAGVGPALYGLTRGYDAGEEAGQRKQAFESDQAIRTERLGQEKELFPLRKRALETGLEDAELNRAILKLKKQDQEKVSAELQEVLRKRGIFQKGIGEFMASADPTKLTATVGELFPEAFINPEGIRNEDGSISISHGEGEGRKTSTFRGRNVNKETGKLEPVTEGVGKDVSPDEEAAMMAQRLLDPMGHFERKLTEQYGLEKIAATGEWRVKAAEKRATEAGERAERALDARGEADLERFYNRQNQRLPNLIKNEFETPTMTGMIKGFMQFNDTEFRGKFQALVEDELEEGRNAGKKVLIGKAFENAREKVRNNYDAAHKAALSNAQGIAQGVKWDNAEQLSIAAERGDVNARRLMQTVNLVSKAFGTKVGQHLLKQVGAEQKKRGTARPRAQAVERPVEPTPEE